MDGFSVVVLVIPSQSNCDPRMSPIDDSKSARTVGKRAVTNATRRLDSGVEMAMDSVADMAKSLDLAYCDFVQVAAEFRELCDEEQVSSDAYSVVNGLNLD